MIISKTTTWTEFQPFATEERMAKIRETVTDCAIFDFWQMSIGDFSPCFEGGMPSDMVEMLNKENITVFEVVAIQNAVISFVKEFTEAMQIFTLLPDNDTLSAQSGIPNFSPIENMLIFTREYFGLHNFGSAESMTLLEYMLAKKHDYARQLFDRNRSKSKSTLPKNPKR